MRASQDNIRCFWKRREASSHLINKEKSYAINYTKIEKTTELQPSTNHNSKIVNTLLRCPVRRRRPRLAPHFHNPHYLNYYFLSGSRPLSAEDPRPIKGTRASTSPAYLQDPPGHLSKREGSPATVTRASGGGGGGEL
jgi:hypothetical protein